ncbi:MAG: 4-alpha-glucanotransferase [Propionibacteriaceae bacterium]
MDVLDPSLRELAAEYGIAVDYWDWKGVHVVVPAETIRAVLAALDVDASSSDAAWAAVRQRREAPWRRLLPPVIVTQERSQTTVEVHVPDGQPVEVWLEMETGEHHDSLQQTEDRNPPREIDGVRTREATFALPEDLPLGYHRLHARSWTDDGTELTANAGLIITPRWVGLPPSLGQNTAWGLATQLYSVTSGQSWGTGDLSDLTDLGVWAGVQHGADYVLINPLHAAEPVPPMEPSPYLPTSRRFANPIYLRPERIAEFVGLSATDRARVDELRRDVADRTHGRVDRDASWAAKRAALELIFAVPRTPGRELALAGYQGREGRGLTDYATWAALAEAHGPDWTAWPAELQHPDADGVTAFRNAHPSAVAFHCWLQWVLDEQLAETQQTLRRNGLGLGVMADLAVGVHPRGADAWALQETYATGIAVGAPPDPFNQNGQSWAQPPWRPDVLAEAGYAPYRRLVSTVLRHSGGIRVDHVIGLFRLWWIPAGGLPTAGTYVRYDHEAMIGILALEAHRAEAVVVGEDLGTVEPWVRVYLRERGILGTSILWFEFDHDGEPDDQGRARPLVAERWREYCLASVTTHDLPPSAGYLAGDHVRLRDELGLLTRPVAEELAIDQAEQQAWLDELRRVGLLPAVSNADEPGAGADLDVRATVEALHRYLSRTPSRLRCVALTDAVGDRSTQNQPGTVDEYPNWRVPLTGPDGRPLSLEDVFADERAATLADVVAGRRP